MAILPRNLGKSLAWIFRPKAGDTTASSKVLQVQNGAGSDVMTVDIEGDGVFAGDLTVTGKLTAGSQEYTGSDFTTDITVTTDKLIITAANGNLTTAGTLNCDGAFSVATNKLTCSADGNLACAGTFAATGASTLTGALTANGGLTTTTVAATGAVTGALRQIISAASGSTQLTAAQSGAVVCNTGTSSTTTFVLPTAAAGLAFTFVEAGDAAGELLVTPYSGGGDIIVGKTHGAENATGIATAANSGIKNTAATNVRGDTCTLVAITDGIWHMTSVAGVWAAQ